MGMGLITGLVADFLTGLVTGLLVFLFLLFIIVFVPFKELLLFCMIVLYQVVVVL